MCSAQKSDLNSVPNQRMPHNSHNSHAGHTGSSGDDLSSTDEVKIYKDEGGDREDEKILSENLLEEKSSLIDLTESEDKSGKHNSRQDHSPVFGKVEPHSSFNMGYLVAPYSYTNGAAGGLPVSMANKMGLSPFFCHNGDPLSTPPPAHCGIPPYQLDPKTMGLSRPTLYPFPASQYPYPMLSPDMSQVASWHTPSVYSAASGFRGPYPSSIPINTSLSSDFSFRFSPSLLPSVHSSPHHVLNSHPAIVTPGPKQDIGQDSNHRYGRNTLDHQKNSPGIQSDKQDSANEKKKPHIKKPLNAFMLYMKEMRAKVVAECTLKESAAINQILGRRWHALGREEQAKYYELARRERQLHMQMYPDWSSRTNASRGKKRKRKQDPNDGGNNMKKCRARFGLDQQNQWCKPCRRKKKCIRYMESEGDEGGDLDNHVSDDNLGSCGSVDDAKTPEDDTESLNQSLSSPGCGSVLSSLQSPSASLASPLNLLASPLTPQGIIHNTDHQSMYVDSQSSQSSHQQQKKLNNNNNMNSNSSVVPTSTTSTATSTSDSALLHHNHMNQTLERMSPLPRPPSDSTSLFDIKPNIKIEPGLLGSLPASSRKLGKIHLPNPSLQQHRDQHSLSQSQHNQQHLLPHPEMFFEKATRNPVGVNPQDINNPLSINQLTKPVYVNHHSPIHPQHHHLINIGSPLSPASTSSSSSLVTSLHQSLPLSTSASQHQQHQNAMRQHLHHNMNFTTPSLPVTNSHHPQHPHSHHHHLSHHLQHLAPSLSHGYPMSPAATISSSQIPPPQGVSAATGHHRGGDDGCAISVT
ncbi:protein pangolin, isoforms A/H/I/S isoform X4 [Bradysia coprophila]|uniref:protein pangolin, isoforms A/H/I/S isoform X4 n=1 Tax=Bradysia coprophila TaxID=38358 RepID=UPI00187DBC69|nr:protein pangolin, isoforms A/H/I/S isoform X4 [Bradysia coprophila]